jgi:hypothetical protein
MDREDCTLAGTAPSVTQNDGLHSRPSVPNPKCINSRVIQKDDCFLDSAIEEVSIAVLQNCGAFLENGILPIDTMVKLRH